MKRLSAIFPAKASRSLCSGTENHPRLVREVRPERLLPFWLGPRRTFLLAPGGGAKIVPNHQCSLIEEGWLSPVEGTRLEIERTVKGTVGSNPTPSAISCCKAIICVG